MSYKQVKNLEPTEFKRLLGETHVEETSTRRASPRRRRMHPLCGVTPATFEQMVKVVAAEKVLAKKRMRARRVSRRFSAPSRVVDQAN